MPFLDTNHQRAALLILLLGAALVVALSPYATGILGIPVLYAVFAPVHQWLARRVQPKLAAGLVVALALFLIVVPGASFAGLIVSEAQGIAGNVVRSPVLKRLAELHPGGMDLGPRLAELGTQLVSWIGSSAFGLIGTATRLALDMTIALFGLFYVLVRPGQTWEAVRPTSPSQRRTPSCCAGASRTSPPRPSSARASPPRSRERSSVWGSQWRASGTPYSGAS